MKNGNPNTSDESGAALVDESLIDATLELSPEVSWRKAASGTGSRL